LFLKKCKAVSLAAALSTLPLLGQGRVVTSVIPSLVYGGGCSSTVVLRNLSERTVTVEVEGHRESGAMVGLAGLAGATLRLDPQSQTSYKLDIEEETMGAWAKVRERIPSADLQPGLAISASTDCVVANQLRTAARTVTYPTRSPWFDGDVSEMHGNMISLINASESAVRASGCYSAGGLYSTAAELRPICNATFDVQNPPFGSRQFPVLRDGSTHLSLKTRGPAIVLEMLKPLGENLHVYSVDSSISFGSEAPDK
jgi:hypothetical protein